MSLDNVLAVAGAPRAGIPACWSRGWRVSVVLMAVAATLIARLLERYRWIAWVGLSIVLFVACKLIWEGGVRRAGAYAGVTLGAARRGCGGGRSCIKAGVTRFRCRVGDDVGSIRS